MQFETCRMGPAGGSNLRTFDCVYLFRGATWAGDTNLGMNHHYLAGS